MLALLHLCDSLFPIGGFSHSDGLEAATATGMIRTAADLRQWMDVSLDEAFGRSEGPGVLLAWRAFSDRQWDELDRIDAEMFALRPSSTARAASRSMGARLIKTWQRIRPHQDLDSFVGRCQDVTITLPVAFGVVCAVSGIEAKAALEGFAYTRLAATTSSAMRLMPIGQHEAHTLLADALARVPAVIDMILDRQCEPCAFMPAFDLAVMSQQYVHSRLFRS